MDSYGICLDGFVALRAQPASSAEMISSLVFGEQYEIKEFKDNWFFIENISDGYQGWLSASNHFTLKDKNTRWNVFKNTGTLINQNTEQSIHLTPGCFLPELINNCFTYKHNVFELVAEQSIDKNNLRSLVQIFLGTPYLWGGRSIYGIDCSGFAQMVFRAMGKVIPRDSGAQSKVNNNKLSFEELRPNDLVFFTQKTSNISHVGINLGNNRIIHSSGNVHIDNLTPNGIALADGSISHKYAWGIRV